LAYDGRLPSATVAQSFQEIARTLDALWENPAHRCSPQAIDIVAEFRKHRLSPDVMGFRQLMGEWHGRRAKRNAVLLFKYIQHIRMPRNIGLYNSILKTFRDSGSNEGFHYVLSAMKVDRLIPTRLTYNLLIAIYGAHQQFQPDKAFEAYDQMKANGWLPSVRNLVQLAEMAATNRSFFDRLHEVGKELLAVADLDQRGFDGLIRAYSRSDDPKAALTVLEEAQNRKVPLSDNMIHSVVKAWSSVGNIDEAFNSLQLSRKLNMCTPRNHNAILRGMVLHKQYERLQELLDLMKTDGLLWQEDTFIMLIVIAIHQKDVALAARRSDEMMQAGYDFDAQDELHNNVRQVLVSFLSGAVVDVQLLDFTRDHVRRLVKHKLKSRKR